MEQQYNLLISMVVYIFIHHIMVAQQKKIYSNKLNNLTKVE